MPVNTKKMTFVDSGVTRQTSNALHVVAAAHCGAEELATTEKPTKPIHRTRLVKVVSIHE